MAQVLSASRSPTTTVVDLLSDDDDDDNNVNNAKGGEFQDFETDALEKAVREAEKYAQIALNSSKPKSKPAMQTSKSAIAATINGPINLADDDDCWAPFTHISGNNTNLRQQRSCGALERASTTQKFKAASSRKSSAINLTEARKPFLNDTQELANSTTSVRTTAQAIPTSSRQESLTRTSTTLSSASSASSASELTVAFALDLSDDDGENHLIMTKLSHKFVEAPMPKAPPSSPDRAYTSSTPTTSGIRIEDEKQRRRPRAFVPPRAIRESSFKGPNLVYCNGTGDSTVAIVDLDSEETTNTTTLTKSQVPPQQFPQSSSQPLPPIPQTRKVCETTVASSASRPARSQIHGLKSTQVEAPRLSHAAHAQNSTCSICGDTDSCSRLVGCNRCSARVHAICGDVDPPFANWLCSICKQESHPMQAKVQGPYIPQTPSRFPGWQASAPSTPVYTQATRPGVSGSAEQRSNSITPTKPTAHPSSSKSIQRPQSPVENPQNSNLPPGFPLKNSQPHKPAQTEQSNPVVTSKHAVPPMQRGKGQAAKPRSSSQAASSRLKQTSITAAFSSSKLTTVTTTVPKTNSAAASSVTQPPSIPPSVVPTALANITETVTSGNATSSSATNVQELSVPKEPSPTQTGHAPTVVSATTNSPRIGSTKGSISQTSAVSKAGHSSGSNTRTSVNTADSTLSLKERLAAAAKAKKAALATRAMPKLTKCNLEDIKSNRRGVHDSATPMPQLTMQRQRMKLLQLPMVKEKRKFNIPGVTAADFFAPDPNQPQNGNSSNSVGNQNKKRKHVQQDTDEVVDDGANDFFASDSGWEGIGAMGFGGG